MASVIIPNMPDDLHRRLATEAARSGRSLDQQVIAVLSGALRSVPPVRLPKPIQPLRPVSAEEVAAAIREGRE
jgi:plasmid stability protein